MSQALLPSNGRGAEILAYIKRELGVPDMATRIVVTFQTNDVIRVECDYIPSTPETEPTGDA